MDNAEIIQQLQRVADALERLSPVTANIEDLHNGMAFRWDGRTVKSIANFRPVALDMLTAIDDQKASLLENTRRHANGFPAHDALLWGSRGMGKSALIKAVLQELNKTGNDIALVEAGADQLDTLPGLLALLEQTPRAFILFIDDIGFDDNSTAPRLLRSLLEGGVQQRPANVRIYATSNRRHIVPRNMSEQDDPVNPRDVLDDRLALSDRFGLRLGFHAATQDEYLAMIARYASVHGLDYERGDAIAWASRHGGRSGRTAWQFIVELAGAAKKKIT